MVLDFFTFWVIEVCGGALMSLFVTAIILTLIGIIGKMSYMLLTTLLMLFFITFGVIFFGLIVYLPLILLSATYFGFQLYKYFTRD